uniref:Uncharacterized protein n=1 Tax=viral metagenome TaxID=1070528 RepID=A0A6C0HMT9_9ZZZZ
MTDCQTVVLNMSDINMLKQSQNYHSIAPIQISNPVCNSNIADQTVDSSLSLSLDIDSEKPYDTHNSYNAQYYEPNTGNSILTTLLSTIRYYINFSNFSNFGGIMNSDDNA